MSGPIVFISHNAVKEGKLEGFRDAFGAVAEALDAEKPGTVVFLAFADEDGSEVSVVHVFPDADAMGRHLEGVQERMGTALEFIQTRGTRSTERRASRCSMRCEASPPRKAFPCRCRPITSAATFAREREPSVGAAAQPFSRAGRRR